MARLSERLLEAALPGWELPLSAQLYYGRQYYLQRLPLWQHAPPMAGPLRALIEGEEALTPGRAVDVGCGTGRNALYMALHGWKVIGVDIYRRPLRLAHAAAVQLGVANRASFVRIPATRLDRMPRSQAFDLALDVLGAASDLAPHQLARYGEALRAVLRPGSPLLIFTFVEPAELLPLETHFELEPGSARRWPHLAGRWHLFRAR